MKTKVVAAFPGSGKSYLLKNNVTNLKIVDIDSNSYTLGHDKRGRAISANFPNNYIAAITGQLGDSDILLISIHKEILDQLQIKRI